MAATPIAYKEYKTDADKAKRYNARLAMADQKFDGFKGQIEDWWDRYENTPLPQQVNKKGHRTNVTTGVSVVDALFSGLTAIDVEFLLNPAGRATMEQAMLAETALNAEWAAMHVDEERDAAIKDALVARIGWVKVAYEYVSTDEEVERDLEDVRAEVQSLLAEARDAGLESPSPDVIAQLVPTHETQEVVHRDRITTDYVPWDDIRFDPTARRWKDVRWVAQLTKVPTEDLKNNTLYRTYVKRSQNGLGKLDKLKGDSQPDTQRYITMRPQSGDYRAEEFSTVAEMHDLETGTVCTFVKGQDWLLNESVNPYALHPDFPDRSAFVPLVLRSTNRRVEGISDMEVMVPSLDEKNLYRTRQADFIDRFVPKVIGPENALTEEGKTALSNNEYGAYVSTALEVDPQAVKPMSPPVLPTEVFGMNDRIDNEIREATGVNELMRGLFPDRKRTATETAEVVSASAARQSEKRNTLERFHIEIAQRILQLMQQFYDQGRVATYSDPSLGNVPWEWTADDIIGEFVLNVNLSPREAQTRDQMKDEANTVMNVLGPFAQPGPDGSSLIDPGTLIQWMLRKYGVSRAEIVELMTNPAEQQVQQQKQLQDQAAQAKAQGAGIPDAGLTSGPLTPAQTAAAANPAGPVPPEVLAAAIGGFGPGAPDAAREVSQSRGVQ